MRHDRVIVMDYRSDSDTEQNEEDELKKKAFIPMSVLMGALLLALAAAMCTIRR